MVLGEVEGNGKGCETEGCCGAHKPPEVNGDAPPEGCAEREKENDKG